MVFTRNNEGVPVRQRINVEERDDIFSFVHPVTWQLVCCDLTENALAHEVSYEGIALES